MAASFQSGKPALITPLGVDQFDSSFRPEKLGGATALNRDQLTKKLLEQELARIARDNRKRQKAMIFSEILLAEENEAHRVGEIIRGIQF